MMEFLSKCPICGHTNFQVQLAAQDYTVSRETFQIVKCDNCAFSFTNPRPDKDNIGKYYESEEYVSHSNTKKGLINSIYQKVREFSIAKKIELLNRISSKGYLLDIGCGTGEFLNAAKEDGWVTEGVEPNEKAKQQAVSNYQLHVESPEQLQNFESTRYDIISMWHVLEHVHDLNGTVQTIKRLLKKGGKAIIAVPNLTSRDAKIYKSEWAAYDVPRHLYHFSPASIKELFQRNNLKFVQSLPMKFDSFYVAMLSEKNMHGKNRLIQAFFNGLRSNLSAGKDSEKYSSVIYIFES